MKTSHRITASASIVFSLLFPLSMYAFDSPFSWIGWLTAVFVFASVMLLAFGLIEKFKNRTRG
jgi:hypothetical protein